MAESTPSQNKFEFVIVAGARARQLLNGCTPKTSGPEKLVKLAQKEVREGKIQRLPTADCRVPIDGVPSAD